MEALRKVYGDAFLRYVLNLDDLGVSEETLSDGRRQAIGILEQAAQRNPEENDLIFRLTIFSRMGQYTAQIGTNLCTATRHLSTGGSIRVDGDDTLLNNLWNLGAQIWPIFLLPPSTDRAPALPHLAQFTFNHPTASTVWQEILNDRALKRLFPHAPGEIGDLNSATEISSMLTFSTGNAGTVQLVMLPDIILTTARYRQLLHGGDDLESYLIEVERVLDEARRLSRKKKIEVPYLLGLSNMGLPSGNEVSIPFGTIRPTRDSDQTLISISGNMSSYVSTVLEATHPFEILAVEPLGNMRDLYNRFEAFQTEFNDCREQAELDVMACRLSLLLASDDTTLIAPAIVSRSLLDTFNLYPLQIWPSQPPQPSGISVLDSASIRRAADWSTRIRIEDLRKLKMGVRRILSAASERIDPLDSLIDAVICWENMFGSKTETTFRICGAMACLLQPEYVDRRANLMSELKKIYDIRSDIVHGRDELSPNGVQQYRNTAIQHGIESLRRLLVDPKLMSTKDSARRGERILLATGYIND